MFELDVAILEHGHFGLQFLQFIHNHTVYSLLEVRQALRNNVSEIALKILTHRRHLPALVKLLEPIFTH